MIGPMHNVAPKCGDIDRNTAMSSTTPMIPIKHNVPIASGMPTTTPRQPAKGPGSLPGRRTSSSRGGITIPSTSRLGAPGYAHRFRPALACGGSLCSTVRRRERAHVDLTALVALADLLYIAVHDDRGSSVIPSAVANQHADLRSRDQSQGADHALISPEVCPTGSVRSVGRQPTSQHTTMAQSARSDAAKGDGSDDSNVAVTPEEPRRGSGGRDGRGEQ